MKKNKNTILIAESEADHFSLLEKLLGKEYTFLRAEDGARTKDIAKELSPDLIILDVTMPDMSGFDIISSLKAMETTCEIPIILLSDVNSTKEEEKGFSLGAVDYIQKSLPAMIVKSRVKNHMDSVNQKRLLEKVNIFDTFTGTYNGNFLKTRLSQEWRRSMRDGMPLSIMLIGIDDFQEYDEETGGLLLQGVAEAITANLKRPMDIVARLDEEVFAVLMPNTPAYGAEVLAENICKAIEGTVGVSIGIDSIIPEMDNTSSHEAFLHRTRIAYEHDKKGNG